MDMEKATAMAKNNNLKQDRQQNAKILDQYELRNKNWLIVRIRSGKTQ